MGENVGVVEDDAFGFVVEVDFFEAQSHVAIVEEDVGLEVVFKTTEVDVGRAAGAKRIVADEQFAVIESGAIEAYFYAGFESGLGVRSAGPLDDTRIAPGRKHQSDVYTCLTGGAHGEKNGFGGQEVGRLHVDIFLRLEQDAHVALHDVGPGRDRTTRHDLCDAVVANVGREFGIIGLIGDKRPSHEIPIYKEGTLNAVDRSAAQSEMRAACL